MRRSTSEIRAGGVDSCSAPAELRWRSEEKLRGGEAFDNLHGSAAKRTLPQRVKGSAGEWAHAAG
jgi:hypothetical protein